MSSAKPGWFVVSTDRQLELGPFSAGQLMQLARDKRVKPETLIRHNEFTKGKRVAATAIKQLKELFDAQQSPSDLIDAEPFDPEDEIYKAGKKIINSTVHNVSSAIGSLKSMIPVKGTEVNKSPPSDLSNFLQEGQDEAMVLRLLERVLGICISGEKPLYMAVQQRPIANFSPDAVVLTNNRCIVFRQKMLGRMSFEDCLWKDIGDLHMEENIMSATFKYRKNKASSVTAVDWLPKEQARKIYRIAQEQEQEAIKLRREMYLEEQRAGADQSNVVTNVASVPAQSSDDPIAKLQKLKSMLDSGLIEKAEFDALKQKIIADF